MIDVFDDGDGGRLIGSGIAEGASTIVRVELDRSLVGGAWIRVRARATGLRAAFATLREDGLGLVDVSNVVRFRIDDVR